MKAAGLGTRKGIPVKVLARGELGESFSARRPVSTMIADAIPATLLLAGTALAIEFILGLAIGVWQAVHRDRRWEAAVTVITLFFYSLPTFWLGLILLLLFGERLHWFPVGGIVDPATHDALSFGSAVLDRLRHLVLPATTLGLIGAAGTRCSLCSDRIMCAPRAPRESVEPPWSGDTRCATPSCHGSRCSGWHFRRC